MKYRQDIDGLRAIAVMSVIFFHGGIEFFSGGYVGVDIFFVISGFLICRKILLDSTDNRFSLLTFYERRIRRIFPAMFFVLFATMIIAYFIYDYYFFLKFANSAKATTLFLSNIYFWLQSGYFDVASSLKPLLHMWSLSMEEQFYIVFPILIIIIHRFFNKKFTYILLALAIVSLIFNVLVLQKSQSSAFYLPHLRAWEFLVGAILATTIQKKYPSRLRQVFSLAGILLILFSVVIYSDDTHFPGLAATLPVLGTVLLIYVGEHGTHFISKALSIKPLVFVGKISYSLYLWHWPLLVFAKYFLIKPLSSFQLVLWLIVTFILSSLTWALVENPFRLKTNFTQKQIYILAIVCIVASLISIYFLTMHKRSKSTVGGVMQLDSSQWDSEKDYWEECIDGKICSVGDNNTKPSYIAWGDSHAVALGAALNNTTLDTNTSGFIAGLGGCPPLIGISRVEKSLENTKRCQIFKQNVITFIEDHNEIKTIILIGRWPLSVEGNRFKGEDGIQIVLTDSTNQGVSMSNNYYLFEKGLIQTIQFLSSLNKDVVIVNSIPEVGFNVPTVNIMTNKIGRDANNEIAPTYDEFTKRNANVEKTFNKLKDIYPNLKIIDPSAILCSEKLCRVVVDNKPLYSDDDHLSTFGSNYVKEIFYPMFHNNNL